jgi:hypothetical protein
MSYDVAPSAQLAALRALLETARDLAARVDDDPTIGRLLRAFLTLPPDDRDVVVGVLERGTAWRRIADCVADVTGVELRANPQARLFVRVVEPRDGALTLEQEPPEILLGALRIMKQAALLLRPEVAERWRAPALEAFRMIDAEEREACVRLVRHVLALLAGALAAADVPIG